MRLLHVAAPGEVGGLEQVVAALATGQQRRGHEVHVAALVDGAAAPNHPWVDRVRQAGVPVTTLSVPNRAYLRERRLMADLCDRLRPDIMHTHGYRADVLHSGIARRRGLGTVSTVHGFTGGDWKNRLFEYLDRRALRRFSAVAAVSAHQTEQLRRSGVSATRLYHLPNAWLPGAPLLDRAAARQALGAPPQAFLVGWVGRLSSEKGPDVFVEALAGLRTQEWHAVVLGDGPERATLARRAAALGIGDRLRWTGIVPDAARLYGAFDVFVLSSRTEGIPIVLFEAMRAGTPIVATRVGGVPEVLDPGAALLSAPGDAMALAAAIDDVARDPAAAAARAGVARRTLDERFSVEPWLSAYDDLYRRTRSP